MEDFDYNCSTDVFRSCFLFYPLSGREMKTTSLTTTLRESRAELRLRLKAERFI